MRKTQLNMLISLLFIAVFFSQARAETIPELAILDGLRTQGETVKVTTRIELYEQGTLKSSSVLDVYVGTNQRSLAVYRSEREAGQKVLMVDDKFWLFLPSSKRAMRITAMQKMMGEASVGDVASLEWQQDYSLQSRVENDEGQIVLTLHAARKGLSYDKVTLWVSAQTLHPIKADFFMKSGKLAKQATFDLQRNEDDQWYMASLALQDRVQKDQLTVIYYDSVDVMAMQDKWFTPNYLLRAAP